MKITVLGSASGMPISQRNSSAYLVEVKSRLYLVDAGEGVAQQLVRYQIDPSEIYQVFITHVHADHAVGLFMLLQWMHLCKRKDPLAIYLPKGVLQGLNAVLSFFHIFQEKWSFQFDFHPISERFVFNQSGFQLSAIPNYHLQGNEYLAAKSGWGSDSYSFLLTEENKGKVIYTSDVDSLVHLEANKKGVDILISECAHISVEDILDFACSAGIPRVILTHIPPEMEHFSLSEIRKLESMTVELVSDGQVIEV
ncbi:MBL fold metallo-hydrolase [bacterium]|nr:MBL fold metallo-hydrolase [bacterium]